MDKTTLINLLVGILAGWVVIIFHEPYCEFKGWLIEKRFPKLALDIFMPVLGLLILFLAVILVVEVG